MFLFFHYGNLIWKMFNPYYTGVFILHIEWPLYTSFQEQVSELVIIVIHIRLKLYMHISNWNVRNWITQQTERYLNTGSILQFFFNIRNFLFGLCQNIFTYLETNTHVIKAKSISGIIVWFDE